MTDRLKGVYVVFESDIRVDDVEVIINAISLIRGVAGVDEILANPDDWMARQRIVYQFSNDIFDLLKKMREP